MLSQENNLAEIRGSISLQIPGHVGNPSILGHPQNRVHNLLDLGDMQRMEIGLEDVRIDSSPVVIYVADEVYHVLKGVIQIRVFRIGSIRNSHGTSFLKPSMVFRLIKLVEISKIIALVKAVECNTRWTIFRL